MSERRVGIWFVGALGGVASTAALGISALAHGLTDTTSLVTATPLFQRLPLAGFKEFIIGGHDIRRGSYSQSVRELHQRAGIFDDHVIQASQPDLERWTTNVRPGTVLGTGATIGKLVELPEVDKVATPREAVERIGADLNEFRQKQRLDALIVANVASTEPPIDLDERFDSIASFRMLECATRRSRPAPCMAGPPSILEFPT